MRAAKHICSGSRNQRGITGLETAIILIAFVVVAAVFAYTILSAGLFSTQKSSEAVYSGLEEAQASLDLDGAVMAYDDGNSSTQVGKVEITLKLALDGEPIDFTPNSGNTYGTNRVVISYSDESQHKNDLHWTLSKLAAADSDNILENRESFQITIAGLESGTNALANPLVRKEQFMIEIKPNEGAPLRVERRVPGKVDTVMNLN